MHICGVFMMSRPSYSDALDAVVCGICEVNKFTIVHEYVVVLIAGIVADLYELETRQVIADIRELLPRKSGGYKR